MHIVSQEEPYDEEEDEEKSKKEEKQEKEEIMYEKYAEREKRRVYNHFLIV